MRARSASGSVDSPSAVEPTRSQKRTVTTLRCSRAGSTTASAVPHALQKRASPGSRARSSGRQPRAESTRVVRREARRAPLASALPRRRCPSARGRRSPARPQHRRFVDAARAREHLAEDVVDVVPSAGGSRSARRARPLRERARSASSCSPAPRGPARAPRASAAASRDRRPRRSRGSPRRTERPRRPAPARTRTSASIASSVQRTPGRRSRRAGRGRGATRARPVEIAGQREANPTSIA